LNLIPVSGNSTQAFTAGPWSLQNYASLGCLEDTNYSDEWGNFVYQNTCTYKTNQQWNFISATNLYTSLSPASNYTIQNSGNCFNVDGTSGDQVQAYMCSLSYTQLWSVVQNSDGSHTFYSMMQNLVLTANGLTAGTTVIATAYTGDTSQNWFIYDNGQFVNAKTNLCISVQNGSPVYQYYCTANSYNLFTTVVTNVTPPSGLSSVNVCEVSSWLCACFSTSIGYYFVIENTTPMYYLTVEGQGTNCAWVFSANTDGSYQIQNYQIAAGGMLYTDVTAVVEGYLATSGETVHSNWIVRYIPGATLLNLPEIYLVSQLNTSLCLKQYTSTSAPCSGCKYFELIACANADSFVFFQTPA